MTALTRKRGAYDVNACRRITPTIATAVVYILVLGTTALNAADTAAGESDEYLNALKAEAARLEVLGQAKKEHEALLGKSKGKTGPSREKPQKNRDTRSVDAKTNTGTLPLAEFETVLRHDYPGSYALYSRMKPRDKAAVYQEYKNAKSHGIGRFLPPLRKIIVISTSSPDSDRTSR